MRGRCTVYMNFEVTGATQPILSVKKGADAERKKDHPRHGINPEKHKDSGPRTRPRERFFRLGCENSQSAKEQHVQPVDRAWSLTAKEHKKQCNIGSEEHETNVDHSDRTPATLHEPTAGERTEHELTRCSYRARCAICVGAKSLGGHHSRVRKSQSV